MKLPDVVETIADLRRRVTVWRGTGARVGLAPTMGALHEGHLSLVRAMEKHADKIIVSIFVNPAQFAPHEDFDRYPRALADDRGMLAGTGAVDLVFAPARDEMYPAGFATALDVGGPSAGLETAFRPHFFGGVATIVAKLLIAAMPNFAIFGEKDYQQLLVVRRLTVDLGLPIEILGAPIVREPDGLAMSSRNAYLSPQERKVAGRLNLVLKNTAAQIRGGMASAEAEIWGVKALGEAGFNSVDYLAIRDASTLQIVSESSRPARILAAARIGATRLIDNMEV